MNERSRPAGNGPAKKSLSDSFKLTPITLDRAAIFVVRLGGNRQPHVSVHATISSADAAARRAISSGRTAYLVTANGDDVLRYDAATPGATVLYFTTARAKP